MFKIKNKNRYPLPVENENNPFIHRWEHRATITYRNREFIAFVDAVNMSCFIEEVVGGHLEVIKDDSLFDSINFFCEENEIFKIYPPIEKKKRR